MRKVVLVSVWLFTIAGAGFAGYQYGLSEQVMNVKPVVATPKSATNELASQADSRTNARSTSRPNSQADPLQDLINAGRFFAAIDVIKTRLAQAPSDHTLRFKLAELYEETHQFDAAISELLTIRSLSLNDSELALARRQIDRIVRAADTRFQARRSTAEAISFFERQSVQEPSYDLHRYFLAKWFLSARDTDTAERIIRELGLAGITRIERDDLRRELERLTSTLPIRRQGNSLYADVQVTTPTGQATLTMLVDTGASLTAIAHYQLRELGAIRTPHRVQAQTANGTVEVPMYELLSITGGPLTLEYFLVGSLNELPDHVDGLLGLDFLDQLPVPIVNAP